MNDVSHTAGASRDGVGINATEEGSHCLPGTTVDDKLHSKLTNRRSLSLMEQLKKDYLVDSLYNALKQKTSI